MSKSAMPPSDSPFLVNKDNDTTTSIALKRQDVVQVTPNTK